jgi:hypothetical protein
MAQQILNSSNINDFQIVSGTEIMSPGEGGAHTRILTVFVPRFQSRPDITVTISTPEMAFLDTVPGCERESNDLESPCSNPANPVAPWAIQYIPQVGADIDQITISAANAAAGVPTAAVFLCSYIAIGKPI